MESFDTLTYQRGDCVVFCKTKEACGGLSNMAAGYPLCVNGLDILTSEALYQACRFPHRADVQKLILAERSPMGAKMRSKPYRSDHTRRDWEEVNVVIMRWCLRVKLAQNWKTFGALLLSTGDRPIVEESHRDTFWGAKKEKTDPDILTGQNVLGRLLTALREELKQPDAETLRRVEPPALEQFLLDGKEIGVIDG
jgi:type I restriction enzyme S subunit